MLLADIIKGIRVEEIVGEVQRDIQAVHIDSRRIAEGHLFVAMRGTVVDGHKYIQSAIDQGATAIVCEQLPEALVPGITYVRVANSEEAVGPMATAFNDYPTEKVKLIGVTGTNGKTTIATLLYDMFRAMGYKVGLVSTVCNYIDDEAIPTEHTTPDAITLNTLLGRMANEGCKYVFMEVSSHSVAQHRIGGLKFAGGILMTQNTRAKVHTYSLRSLADFKGRILEHYFDGMLLDINNVEVFAQFIGRFNASNLLAVYGTAILLGKQPEEVLTVLSTLRPVNGRFDALHSPLGYTAIVDYAHTPDAITNVLNAIHEVQGGKGKVLTVVGAGGNRDKGKRPLMAQEAVKGSDRVIITSDNPRFEEPADIINDMLEGLTPAQRNSVVTIVDRREAIRTACLLAQKGDVILVAGKGHETYQDVKGVKHHFDDKEVLREVFASQG